MAASATTAPQPVPMTRREFLYYIWGASLALFMAEMGGAILWFIIPRFKAGQFGGVFTVDVSDLPPPDAEPKNYADGRFWLVNLGDKTVADERHPQGYQIQSGVVALYKVCVHLGCIYRWIPTNDRFECPCHGSKYLKDGTRVDGPARRNLDKFPLQAIDANGNVLAETRGGGDPADPDADVPLTLPAGTVAIRINTGRRKEGGLNPK